MKRRVFEWVLVALLAGNLALGARMLFAEGRLARATDDQELVGDGYSYMRLFADVMVMVQQHYVEQVKTGDKELVYGALKGMLAALDPHSQFMEPELFEEMKEDAEGRFGGIGISIHKPGQNEWVSIITAMEGTPADKTGLRGGDKIIKIDGKATQSMSMEEVLKGLRGDPGTEVDLTVLKGGTGKMDVVHIVREFITIQSVKDGRILEKEIAGPDRIGYVRVLNFNEQTDEEFEKVLEKLEAEGIGALVIDLRRNPGGLLDSAARVAGKFIPPGEVIVSTMGRDGQEATVIRSVSERKRADYPVAVLVNGASASGAEIVAGALKDLRRAIIVGETTFGKGSVQSVLKNFDGSGLRLTTAKYCTPSKRIIHEVGVEPNLSVAMDREAAVALARHRLQAAIDGGGRLEPDDVQDVQLRRAVDALRAIGIYNRRVMPEVMARTAAR
jgi:carboxyl-terminal processing protease